MIDTTKNITYENIVNHEIFEKYKEYCTRGKGLDKLLRENGTGRFCGNDPTQVLLVIKELLGVKCKKVLEIGVLHGGSMILLQNSDYKSDFVGLDCFTYYGLNKDPHSNVIVSKENAEKNIKKFNKKGHTFTLIECNSQSKEIEKKLIEEYNNFDLIFIDGDHSFEGCQKDFTLAVKLSHPGTIIVFDNFSCLGSIVKKNDLNVKKAVMEHPSLNLFRQVGKFGKKGKEDLFVIEKI